MYVCGIWAAGRGRDNFGLLKDGAPYTRSKAAPPPNNQLTLSSRSATTTHDHPPPFTHPLQPQRRHQPGAVPVRVRGGREAPRGGAEEEARPVLLQPAELGAELWGVRGVVWG